MQETFDKHAYRVLASFALLVIATGTIVYHLVEKFSWLNAYYFSVVTLATVGYGDFVPHTTFGKIFTTFYIFIGVGILATFINYSMRRRAYKFQQHKEKRATKRQ